MPALGPTELIIILFIVLVVFGAGRLPEIGGALGKGIREFKKATTELNEVKTELKQSVSLDAKAEPDTTKPSA